jgi:hypothetical protein
MTSRTPWSVKGIDPKAREIAKDRARRSGLTLGEWLSGMISGGHGEAPRPGAAPDPVLAALQALTERFEASETDQAARAARLEAAVARLQSDQAQALRRLEAAERGGGRAEALRAVEAALERLAIQWSAGEGRAQASILDLREEMRGEVRRAADDADHKIRALEQRNAEALAEVSFEISRAAEALDQRLRRAELARAAAWSKLGGEIARLGERLHAPAAPAPADSTELTDRIRQSEGRMARLLEEARAAARAAPPASLPVEVSEPVVVTPPARPRPARNRRRPWAAVVGALAVCLALGVAAYAVWLTQTPSPPPPVPKALAAITPSVKPAAAPPAPAITPPSKPATPGPAILFQEAAKRLDSGDASGAALLRVAADLGYAPAQRRLGKLYASGGAGLAQDSVVARQWSRKGAEGGDAAAMYDLALDYAHGLGGPQDSVEAARWLQRAAELGVRASQRSLGRYYEAGVGLPQNLEAAYRWYLIAARAGDAIAGGRAEALKGRLSGAERTRAETAAAAFQPGPPGSNPA